MTHENDVDKPIQIQIDIEGRTKKMFEAFRNYYNIERYTDTFRLIVKRAYDLEGFDKEEPQTETISD